MDGDINNEVNERLKPKKRQRNENEWTRNKAKNARLQGRELLDDAGDVVVLARAMQDVSCCCKCSEKFSEEEKEWIYEQFRSKTSHTIQNEYLRGCTMIMGTKFIRGREERLFSHWLRFDKKSVRVCQKFFVGIHGIDRSRLRTYVLRQEVNIEDKRGKHPNHKVVTSNEVRDLMRVYLSALPGRQSHYSITNNPHRRYLDSELNVTELFEQFFKANPELDRSCAKLPVFREIFNNEFNYTFGDPRTDKCSTCERMITSIQTCKVSQPQNVDVVERLTLEHQFHLETAQNFYNDYKQCRELPDDHFALCFDYQKNFPLPSTKVNKEYYISQLWICNFGIKNLRTGVTKLFLYSEHFAQKGANEVVTCLDWYVRTEVPATVRCLHVFCDNTFGQNKNRFVFSILQHFANTRFQKVILTFPTPGHSRMPIDGDFGRITLRANKYETLTYPSDIRRVIEESQGQNPFEFIYVNNNFTDDMCDDGTPVLDVKDYKTSLTSLFPPQNRANLNLLPVREVIFRPGLNPVVNFTDRFQDPRREIILFREHVSAELLAQKIHSAQSAYDDFIPIAENKIRNLQTLMPFVVQKPSLEFYSTIYALKNGERLYIER